ncbi:MAG: energy-coupling factor transporter transmembrane protein EcfT [Micrococcales bacterium]|nr:energy-coupling factor transporter transmembrane protein EcfT [Micrococcales bacterium]
MRSPAVPDWLVAPEPAVPAYEPNGRRRRRGFLEATADQSAQVLRHVVVADETAARPGLLQRLDPRTAVVAMVAALVVVALVHHVAVLLVAWMLVVALAVASQVPLGRTGQAWVLVPVFAALVAAPATLSVVRAGDVVVTLWTWHGADHGLTAQGLAGGALLVTRAGCSVSIVLLVTATTSWARLFAALGALGVPRVFCMVISMAHRYLVLLTGVVADMVTSRQVRTVTGVRHDRAGRAVLGASVGALVGKSHIMADEVHQAMVARGYQGHMRTLRTFAFTWVDLVAVMTAVGVLAGMLVWDGALG